MIRIITTTEPVDGFGCRYRVTKRRLVLFGRLTLWTVTAWTRRH